MTKLPKACYYSPSGKVGAFVFYRAAQKNNKVYLDLYDELEHVIEARSISKAIVKEKRNSCRTWHIIEAVDEYRVSVGLEPVRRNSTKNRIK